MRLFRLEREQYLPAGLDATFGFFADPQNLEALTPPWLHFQIMDEDSGPLQVGTLIHYRLRVRGIPIRWQSEITRWEPLSLFTDLQRRGPYRFWEHTHTFQASGDGTIVRDEVTYAVPGDILAQKLFVGPDLERIFDFRARALDAWASGVRGRGPGKEGLA